MISWLGNDVYSGSSLFGPSLHIACTCIRAGAISFTSQQLGVVHDGSSQRCLSHMQTGYYTSRPLTAVPTASVSYSYTSGSTAGFTPLSGAPMPAALSASLLVCGFAPNRDLTLQARERHPRHASRMSVNADCTHGCVKLAWQQAPSLVGLCLLVFQKNVSRDKVTTASRSMPSVAVYYNSRQSDVRTIKPARNAVVLSVCWKVLVKLSSVNSHTHNF